MIRVWDPFVRVFHWTLALSFAVAWLSAEGWEGLHSAFGYIAGALVVARGLWGFVGTRYARFSQFVRSPRMVMRSLSAIVRGEEARCVGHNPAGGVMIVALLGGLALTAFSGWLLTTDAFWGSVWVQLLHSAIAHLVLILVVFHLIGVAVASVRHRESLVGAMIFGSKRAARGDDVA